MKIGIMSDSHDNLPAVSKAVSVFNDAEVSLVIHAGDFVSPFVSEPLKELESEFVAVFGNCDGERFGLFRAFGERIHRAPHSFEWSGKRILILHEPDNLDALAASGHFDAVIYGHTHDVDVREGRTLIVNPGECCGWLRRRRTVALWDVASGGVDIVSI
ncbi:MAG: metallophosphoesterase [bacterium]